MRLVFTADGQQRRANLAPSCAKIVRGHAWYVSCLRVLLVRAGNARYRRSNRCYASLSRANLSLLRHPLSNWRLYAARGSGYALHCRDAVFRSLCELSAQRSFPPERCGPAFFILRTDSYRPFPTHVGNEGDRKGPHRSPPRPRPYNDYDEGSPRKSSMYWLTF